MTLIVQQKTKAKEKQDQSEKLKVVLQAKHAQISQKRKVVQADLAQAEPALIAAKKNVQSISASELANIRSVNKPSANVLLTMKPIYYMLNKQAKFLPKAGTPDVDWLTIKQFMVNNFISQVQSLKADDINQKVKNFVLKQYLKSKEWKLQDIKHSSTTAYYLASWA